MCSALCLAPLAPPLRPPPCPAHPPAAAGVPGASCATSRLPGFVSNLQEYSLPGPLRPSTHLDSDPFLQRPQLQVGVRGGPAGRQELAQSPVRRHAASVAGLSAAAFQGTMVQAQYDSRWTLLCGLCACRECRAEEWRRVRLCLTQRGRPPPGRQRPSLPPPPGFCPPPAQRSQVR